MTDRPTPPEDNRPEPPITPSAADGDTTYSVEKQLDLSQKSYSQGQLVWRRFLRLYMSMEVFLIIVTM